MATYSKRGKSRVKLKLGKYHWHRRFIKEMKQNKVVQQKILDGTFDVYLNEVVEK